MSTLLSVETTHLFSLTHPLRANELGRDEQPGSRLLGSRKQTVSVPEKPDASPLGARYPTKTLSSRKDPPPSIQHFCAQSRAGSFLAERSLPPGPQSSQRVPTWRHRGRRRPPEVLKFRAPIADTALTAAGGRGGSVRGIGQLRLGGQTAPGLRLRPHCAQGAVCGEEAG